jgi:hypothetical protein
MIESTEAFQDIGLRSSMKKLFCAAYTKPWLALGLEVVTGRNYGTLGHGYHKTHSFMENVQIFYTETETDYPSSYLIT